MTYERLVHYHCGDGKNNDKKSENTYTTNFSSCRLLVWRRILWYGTIPYNKDRYRYDVRIGMSEKL